MFKDELDIYIKAGKGGNGIIHWHREKYITKGGPDGGDGGKGGDVFFRGIRSLSALNSFYHGKTYTADFGGSGESNNRRGANGEDLILDVPIGSYIKNLKTFEEYECLNENEKILVAAGGRGGLGNTRYKSSVTTTPNKCTKGSKGQNYKMHIELRIIADVGFIGFPNAGKSTLLNEITNANAQIGAYPFTTLEPNLGVAHNIVFADIPGIIEGASQGKGLGHKFLKHISRTNLLLHLVSVESNDIEADYHTIRSELEKYQQDLTEKKEIILLTKVDLADSDTIAKKIKILSEFGKVFAVSVYNDKQIKKIFDYIAREIIVE